MTNSASTDGEDAGFTIIEALIVLLIGSTLLSVLTPMLLSSAQMNRKISTVFSERSDWLFFESQISMLVRSFEDPSLRRPQIKQRGQLSFEGNSEYFFGPANAPLGLPIEKAENIVWVGWLRPKNLSQEEFANMSNSFGKLATRIGDRWIVWPQDWSRNATFSYVDHTGAKHLKWPPDEQRNGLSVAQPTLSISPLPSAIVISDEVIGQAQPNLYTYNLKL